MINYFDSLLVLAILLEKKQKDEAYSIWKNNPIRVSSVLLKIETNISLKRFYKRNENRLNIEGLAKRKIQLNKLMNDVFFNDITEFFANSMIQNDSLASCKSLDAIHIATALDISEEYGRSEICFCSFDKNMLKVAKELGFETSGV
jgi:predicted nucleic acid-binding protein